MLNIIGDKHGAHAFLAVGSGVAELMLLIKAILISHHSFQEKVCAVYSIYGMYQAQMCWPRELVCKNRLCCWTVIFSDHL